MAAKVVVRRPNGSVMLRYFYGPEAEDDARAYAARITSAEDIRSAVLVPLPKLPRSQRPTWRAPW